MSEQTKVSFTKGKGNTYISEEVDGYLAMLHSAYEEMEKELKDLENKSASEREQLVQKEEINQILKTEKEQLKRELTNFKMTIEQLEESVREFSNVDEIKESYVNQIEALKRMFIDEQEVKVTLESEKRKLQREVNEHLKVIEELERKNAEMRNASEIEAFYEGKVTELEGIIGSIREGSDALKKKHEISDEAREQPKADNILEQVQAKRQDMLDRTQEEYRKICELFERVNKEYVEITSAIPSEKEMDITKAESGRYEGLEIEE